MVSPHFGADALASVLIGLKTKFRDASARASTLFGADALASVWISPENQDREFLAAANSFYLRWHLGIYVN